GEITLLRAALAGSPAAAAMPMPEPVVEAAVVEEAAPEPVPPPQAAPPPRKRMDLEVLLTQRWGVWLGAAALLLAAVFLVRTAVEQGWLGPAPRCALAVLLGAALIGCAEWLRRRP